MILPSQVRMLGGVTRDLAGITTSQAGVLPWPKYSGSTLITPPHSKFDYLPFSIFRSGSTISTDFQAREEAGISVAKTYYLNTETGSDANDGLSEGSPKATWNAVRGTGDYDQVIIQDGSYLTRGDSSLAPDRDCEIIGEGTVKWTSDRGDDLGTWSLSPGKTNTYETTTSGQFISKVFDESTLDAGGYPARYSQESSIDDVEANSSSYYWDSGTLYVHVSDGSDPTGNDDLKYYDSVAVTRNSDGWTAYFENIQFEGGLVRLRSASAAGGSKIYFKNCGFMTANFHGVDVFLDSCTVGGTKGDGWNYDVYNTVEARGVEIDCEASYLGVATNNQGSTSHNGCPVVSINGHYHHTSGPPVADAQSTTYRWMLGCEMDNSTGVDVGFLTEGQAWLDSCDIHDVSTDLQNSVGSTISIHNLTSGENNTIEGALIAYTP